MTAAEATRQIAALGASGKFFTADGIASFAIDAGATTMAAHSFELCVDSSSPPLSNDSI
jgi:hypothetical protein